MVGKGATLLGNLVRQEFEYGRQAGQAAHLCGQWPGENSLESICRLFQHLDLSSGGRVCTRVGLYLTKKHDQGTWEESREERRGSGRGEQRGSTSSGESGAAIDFIKKY